MTKSSWQMAVLVLLTIACAGLLAACGGEDKKAIATAVAKKWTDTTVNDVSNTVAELIIGEEPIVAQLAGGALAGLIRENITWDYSEPERQSEDRYAITVTATADVKVEIPLAARPGNMVCRGVGVRWFEPEIGGAPDEQDLPAI